MPNGPPRTASARGGPLPAGTAGTAGTDTGAGALERSMRPLVDAALGAAEELEERVAPVHLRALQALATLGPSHVSALADALSLLPSTASRLSDRLAAAGLITRGTSPANRRATLLDLTPSGHDVVAELVQARTARLRRVLATMNDRDRRRLLAGMQAFADADAALRPAAEALAEGSEDPPADIG